MMVSIYTYCFYYGFKYNMKTCPDLHCKKQMEKEEIIREEEEPYFYMKIKSMQIKSIKELNMT